MSVDHLPPPSGDSNHNLYCDDGVRRSQQDFDRSATSFISQATDAEFEHEAADYQWLLDYEYRESFSRESLGGCRDGVSRVSVLQPAQQESQCNYETLSRNIDANLAEIDMDDFRSEDINQFLVLPNDVCDSEAQNEDDEEIYCSLSGSTSSGLNNSESTRCLHHQQQLRLHQHILRQQQMMKEEGDEDERGEEEFSTLSGGDVSSLYQSGPLFSPLREPPHIPPSFSVDSLDSDSIHEDLILTCQANKDNYTIAFEGSFVQFSEESDCCQETSTGESDGSGLGIWSTERLEGRSPAPNMTHSDQPYTTWSRVSRRCSNSSNADQSQQQTPTRKLLPCSERKKEQLIKAQQGRNPNSKSNSMPNLMRKSLMKRSLETSGQCIKVYDLQNSLRSSQLSNARSVDGNNFSLMRLFMKQKSLSKEQVSLCSSFTDPSAEGGSSSDWPMNSQSENDMEGSGSPPNSVSGQLMQKYKRNSATQEYSSSDSSTTTTTLAANEVDNNKMMAHLINNGNNALDGVTSFEDSLKELNPCSKPPMTSPIREEPEGMDISIDSKAEHKVFLDQSEKETVNPPVLRLKDSKTDQNVASMKVLSKEINNKNIQGKNKLNAARAEAKLRSPPAHMQRKRQDSGNSSSGYISNKGSIEKIRKSSESDKLKHILEKPKPKPRYMKQMADQCLQTSILKVSATVNTSEILDKKDVYVYYPNYALPDLSFLKEKKYNSDSRIFLVPQHYINSQKSPQNMKDKKSKRPFSCGDMEKIKKQGLKHIKDWESLNFLLPKEIKEILDENESECVESSKPSFCLTPRLSRRPMSCDLNQGMTNETKDSMNSTQPSSGYRGSSTMLNDSEAENDPRYANETEGPPLPKRYSMTAEENYGDDSETPPPRPPLPRGILRKCTSLRNDDGNKQTVSKRFSSSDGSKGSMREDLLKRRSLQEPLDVSNNSDGKSCDKIMGCSCTSECTGFCGKGLRKKNLLQVTELPEVSSHEDLTEEDLMRIRSQVSEFLAKGGDKAGNVLNSEMHCDCRRKSVSFAEKQCNYHRQIKIATDTTPKKLTHNTPTRSRSGESLNNLQKQNRKSVSVESEPSPMLYDAHDKRTLVLSVRAGVEKILKHFNRGATQQDKNRLGNSNQTAEIAQLVLDKLCPAIYALLSDGLLPSLHSLFGKISNSVWRVVEATSQLGASTKALNDLVLTLNSEDGLTEGPIKFNAFIFGLLNIRSLDAWLGYLRTRESALQKHYHPESFLYLSNTAMRRLYDDLLLALRPLALLPFRLDLLHESKALHVSLLKMEERMALHTSQIQSENDILVAKESKELRNAVARTTERSRSPRPRSCHENSSGTENHQGSLKKRWSGVQLGSKLVTAFDRLRTEENTASGSEDYTDSLENRRRVAHPHSLEDDQMTDLRISDLSSRDGDISERSATYKDTDTEKGTNESEGEKFRRLQLKWEAMTLTSNLPAGAGQEEEVIEEQADYSVRRDTSVSPGGVQRSRIPRPVSITSPMQNFKPFEPSKEKISPQVKLQNRKSLPNAKEVPPKPAPRRSLKDRVTPTDHSADPQRGPSVRSRIPPRTNTPVMNPTGFANRASSVPGRKMERGHSGSRLVQTLHHRLATDNGHLSFSRGDVLTVVVEVDEKFMLCCLHDRKGLVPRTSVVSFHQ